MLRACSTFWILGAVVAIGLAPPLRAFCEPRGSVEITPDVVYGHVAGLALTMDVYRPAERNGAAVLFVNSGNWQSRYEWRQFTEAKGGGVRLSTANELSRVPPAPLFAAFDLRPLLEAGFTVFAVRHGSSPRFDLSEIVAQLRRALRFARSQAPEYGIDPERIGIWGASAGGHLALLLGTTGGDEEPTRAKVAAQDLRAAAIVAYYPPSDLHRYVRALEAAGRSVPPALDMPEESQRKYSPLHFVTAGDPPTLIVHGDHDRVVSIVEGRSMHAALVEADVESRLVVIEGADHGFVGDAAQRATREMVGWFERHLGVD
jgi:acetyl esterase/lipase